jgi:UDP-N-acetylmuramoyl-tripeptide--D-alanyl-D-alanine ligase
VNGDARAGEPRLVRHGRHAQVGRLVAELGIDVLITVGDGDVPAMAHEARLSGPGVAVHPSEDVTGAIALAKELIEPGDVVFVKASSEYGLGACARALR